MRYFNGKPTRGERSWEPLSTQYPREFRIWRGLYTRRFDPAYERYDPLYDEDLFWDFECFLEEVGEVYSQGSDCSLDRKNNELGYVKGNLRWATRSEQMRNVRGFWRTRLGTTYWVKERSHNDEWQRDNATTVPHRSRTGANSITSMGQGVNQNIYRTLPF